MKTKERFIGKGVGDASLSIPIDHLFQDSSGNTVDTLLTPGGKSFKIYEPHWKGESGISLDNVADSFDFSIGAGSQFSRRYDIANVSFDNDEYTITLDKYIDSDEDWMYASGTTNFNATLELRFYKNITRMKPEFNGKFFVKINGNSVSELYLNTNASSDITYAVTGSFNFYYFSDTGKFSIVDGTTKLNLDNDWNYYTSSGGINPHDGTSGAVIHSGGVAQAPNELLQLVIGLLMRFIMLVHILLDLVMVVVKTVQITFLQVMIILIMEMVYMNKVVNIMLSFLFLK